MKAKIAISVDNALLNQLDHKVDGAILRNRSQALEFFLRKGLKEDGVSTAVVLLHHSHHQISLQDYKGKPLLLHQLEFFKKNNVSQVIIVTQHSSLLSQLLELTSSFPLSIDIVDAKVKGNAQALESVKDRITSSALVMSGDTYHDVDLSEFIKKHQSMDKLCTMGLMTRGDTTGYGTAILDGDYIVDFKEKPKHSATTIVNAGIYVIKPEIFELFESATSLEKDVFTKLARLKQLVGCFTYGAYEHVE